MIPLSACGPGPEDLHPDRARHPDGVVPVYEQAVNTYAGPVPRTIVLVMIDTLRADVLGAYGSPAGLTPHLDEFAEQAVVFTQAYATASWTRPSVASMLSGRYSASHTAERQEDILPEEVVLLPEILESAGPAWTFGIHNNGNNNAKVGFHQGWDHFGPIAKSDRRGHPGYEQRQAAGPAVSRLALSLFDDPRAGAAGVTFAFVQYMEPHDPYFPNPGLMQGEEPVGDYAGTRADLDRMVAAGEEAWTEQNIERLRYLYHGEVKAADRAFGALVEGLRARGLWEEALIIVVSDHGEAFWEHGFRAHGKSLYEEEIRVPFMIRLPGRAAGSGRRIPRPVSLVDIAPTVLDVMHLQAHPDFEGRSLVPLIEGRDRSDRLDYVFAELNHHNPGYSMIRHGRMKFIARYWRSASGDRTRLELFDLEADPLELSNLIGDDDYAEPRRRLITELSAWESDVSAWAASAQRVELEDMDAEMIEELRGLGYIQE
jgi:arylsulfatase A-like enzyme